jgi:hypothetical protein
MDRRKKQSDDDQSSEHCTVYTYQSAAVSVPISVRPKVNAGAVSTFCCGEPVIIPAPKRILCNSRPDSCSYILRQSFCIEIPIEFSADSCVGCPSIECYDTSAEAHDGYGW